MQPVTAENYVVLDTNIWLKGTYLLQNSLGAAFLYSISRTHTQLAIPEVIEGEIRKHALLQYKRDIKGIEQGFLHLQVLMGKRDNYRIPSEQEFNDRIDARFFELRQLIKKVPFTFNHAQGALKKIMAELPPNGEKYQQFKDSAIWESLLELAQDKSVYFITGDRDFFKDKDLSKGLADNLAREAEGRIKIFLGIDEYLKQEKQCIPAIDESDISGKIDLAIKDTVTERSAAASYRIVALDKAQISLFLTQTHNVFAADFELSYRIKNAQMPTHDRPDTGLLKVTGSAAYSLPEAEVKNISLTKIFALTESGEPIAGVGATYLSTMLNFGGKGWVPNFFKVAIPGESPIHS
jgi:predicted nucleic acid-binding protein